MTRRRLIGFILCLGVLGAMGICLPFVKRYFVARGKLDALVETIRERNEPVRFSDLHTDDDSVYEIGDRVERILGEIDVKDFGLEEILDKDTELTPSDYGAIEEAVRANESKLQALFQLQGLDECRFRYDFFIKNPIDTPLFAVMGVSKLGQLLRAKTLLALRANDSDRAVEGIRELGGAAELLALEPFGVSHGIRAETGLHAVESLQELLVRFQLDGNQLLDLEQQLGQMESNFRLAYAARGDRAVVFTAVDSLIEECPLLNKSWLIEQQHFLLTALQPIPEQIDAVGPLAESRWEQTDQQISSDIALPKNRVVGGLFPAFPSMRDQAFGYRHHLLVARLGIRVILYQLRENKMPDSLSDVLADDMDQVPTNLWTGEMPYFESSADGFVIRYDAPSGKSEVDVEFQVPRLR